MRGYAFDFLGGTVTVPCDATDELLKEGLAGVFREPNAAPLPAGAARLIIHASLHFWQIFSSGFVANLLSEEWQRLNHFEQTGAVRAKNNGLASFGQRVENQPFSAYELVECWARFWELSICGVTMVAAEEGMDAGAGDERLFVALASGGPEAELYAAPYRWALDEAHNDAYTTQLLFPLIAHHALGSPDPVDVFAKAYARACVSKPVQGLIARRSHDINQAWLAAWHTVFSESILPVLMEHSLPSYNNGVEILERGALRTHPILREYLEPIGALADRIKAAPGSDAVSTLAKEISAHDPWVAFALPGLPLYRMALGELLPPPRVAFINASCAARRPATLRFREVKAGASNVAETYEGRSLDLEQRLRRFRAAEKAVSLGLDPRTFA